MGHVVFDGTDQLRDTPEGAPANPLARDLGEPTLDQGEPRGSANGHAEAEAGADERSRQEGHVEAAEGVLGEAEEGQAVGRSTTSV